MTDLFYVFGGALTALALIISFVGLRMKGFPRSNGALMGGLGLMAVLVVASCGFAVALAREEADHREHELAEHAAEEEEAPAEDPGETPAETEAPVETQPGSAETLELTSPPSGDLMFETEQLDAPAGQIEIDYTNPSPIPHDIAIEVEGETVSQGETVTDGDTSTATADLEPGNYVFFCGVPGHREAGMEGQLTVE